MQFELESLKARNLGCGESVALQDIFQEKVSTGLCWLRRWGVRNTYCMQFELESLKARELGLGWNMDGEVSTGFGWLRMLYI
jgi:hypothetical protein